MGLRDLLKKKQHLEEGGGDGPDPATIRRLAAPEFTFVRSDTYTEEVIHPPGGPAGDSNDDSASYLTVDSNKGDKSSRLSLDVFRSSKGGGSSRSRSASVSSGVSVTGGGSRRLSHRLHLSRAPASSENVPKDLPEIVVPEGAEDDKDGHESQWEKRATMLARENEKNRSRPSTPVGGVTIVSAKPPQLTLDGPFDDKQPPPGPQQKVVSSKAIDEDIQEAIRLHESGQLEKSTALFGRLADPKGANNPLSQVLYGLALRYVPICVMRCFACVECLFLFLLYLQLRCAGECPQRDHR